MRALLRAIDLYRRLIRVQIQSQLVYRASFFFALLAVCLGLVTEFGTLALVLQKFEGIGGWTLVEVALLYGIVTAAFGVMDLFFGGFDPGGFGQLVRRGSFDQLLLRPASITLQVLGSKFWLRRLGRISQGAVVLTFALVHIRWTVVKALYLPVVFVSVVLFFGALFIMGATVTFWTIESIEAVNILTYGGSEMMSYPMHIYNQGLRRFFTYIVPAIFITYYPALFFLDKPDPLGMPSFAVLLSPVVGVGMMAIALAFWRFGIRHYASTGT
jgi:ABC-2 type transport system permease protein